MLQALLQTLLIVSFGALIWCKWGLTWSLWLASLAWWAIALLGATATSSNLSRSVGFADMVRVRCPGSPSRRFSRENLHPNECSRIWTRWIQHETRPRNQQLYPFISRQEYRRVREADRRRRKCRGVPRSFEFFHVPHCFLSGAFCFRRFTSDIGFALPAARVPSATHQHTAHQAIRQSHGVDGYR